MREFCIRLRNLVHSGATKEEISTTQDAMMEEVMTIIWIFCDPSKEHSEYSHLLNWIGSIVIAINVGLNWNLLISQLKNRGRLYILVWDLYVLPSSNYQLSNLFYSFNIEYFLWVWHKEYKDEKDNLYSQGARSLEKKKHMDNYKSYARDHSKQKKYREQKWNSPRIV